MLFIHHYCYTVVSEGEPALILRYRCTSISIYKLTYYDELENSQSMFYVMNPFF